MITSSEVFMLTDMCPGDSFASNIICDKSRLETTMVACRGLEVGVPRNQSMIALSLESQKYFQGDSSHSRQEFAYPNRLTSLEHAMSKG